MARVDITVTVSGGDDLRSTFDPERALKPRIDLGPAPCERCRANAERCRASEDFEVPPLHLRCHCVLELGEV